jgi:hypothetical protein
MKCFLFGLCKFALLAINQITLSDNTETNKLYQHNGKLNYDRQSVGQSVLVSGTYLGSATNFSFSLNGAGILSRLHTGYTMGHEIITYKWLRSICEK